MSCNTKTSLAAVVDAVNAQLNNNYVDRDDPRINQGVFTEPTIRGGLMLDEAAKLDFCGYVTECGQREPFGKQWVDRPLYPYNTLVSYEDEGEIKSRWQDIDDVVAGTEIGESYTTYEETRSLGLQGYTIIDSFELGATITQRNQALRHAADGKLYRWAGDLPKAVPASSTPTNSGGIGANKWLEVSDTTLRQEIVVGGLVNDGVVRTTPVGIGAVTRTQSAKNKDSISVKDYGALGTNSSATVSDWYTVGSVNYRGYADLAAVQVDFPHVTSASDTIDWATIQKTINIHGHVYIPEGVYCVNRTINTRRGIILQGCGQFTVIKSLGITGAILMTYSGTGEPTAPDQEIGNFCLIGDATVAMAASHATNAYIYNIRLSHPTAGVFKGRDGFVFEYFWGSVFSNLYTNGSQISDACFKFNEVILGSTFNQLYTSNFSKYSFWVAGLKEWSTGSGIGDHDNIINMPIAQGARMYGVRIDGGTNFTWHGMYGENNIGALRVTGGINHTFNECNFGGLNISNGKSDHGVYIDGTKSISHINFNNCLFHSDSPFIMGKTSSHVRVYNPRLLSEYKFWDLVRRNNNTQVSMPLSVEEGSGQNPWTIYSKTTNYGHKFASTYLDSAIVDGVRVGSWVMGELLVPPLLDVLPYDERPIP